MICMSSRTKEHQEDGNDKNSKPDKKITRSGQKTTWNGKLAEGLFCVCGPGQPSPMHLYLH